MKKIAVICLALFVSVAGSRADISINWDTVNGVLITTASTPSSYTTFTGNVLIQLIWSANNVYSSASTAQAGGVDVGYTVLFSQIFSVNNGFFGADADGATNYVGNSFNTGYVYGRVFNTAAPTNGSFYAVSGFVGPSLAQATNFPPPLPDDLDMGLGPNNITLSGGDFDGAFGNPLSIEVVPEPATLAFFGLGGLLVALRRRMVA